MQNFPISHNFTHYAGDVFSLFHRVSSQQSLEQYLLWTYNNGLVDLIKRISLRCCRGLTTIRMADTRPVVWSSWSPTHWEGVWCTKKTQHRHSSKEWNKSKEEHARRGVDFTLQSQTFVFILATVPCLSMCLQSVPTGKRRMWMFSTVLKEYAVLLCSVHGGVQHVTVLRMLMAV